MNRPGVLLLLVTLIGASVIGFFILQDRDAQAGDPASTSVSKPRPSFSLPDSQGETFHISALDGKVVVINFWATWCPPCIREIPLLNELHRTYQAQGMEVVGIAIDDLEAVSNFSGKTPIAYRSLIGNEAGMDLASQYGNHHGILPYTVIINRQGHIAHIKYGEIRRDVTEAVIKSLL